MNETSFVFEYADHPPVRKLVDIITYCVESVSLNFDQQGKPHVEGPGLYIVVVAGTTIAKFVDPMGTNRWPVKKCNTVDHDSFFECARVVALNRDGAVVVTVDGTIHEQMVRINNLPKGEYIDAETDPIEYADWMGARHMSALETSVREEVVVAITLSGETGRVTVFRDGEFTTNHREELGAEWRGED